MKQKQVKEIKSVKIYPFNDKGNMNTISGSRIYNISEKIRKGERLTDSEKDFVYKEINGVSCVGSGRAALMGMCFDFRDVATRYVIEDNYGNLFTRWSMDKGTIRRTHPCGIYQILTSKSR